MRNNWVLRPYSPKVLMTGNAIRGATLMRKSSKILLHGREATTVLRHLKEIVLAGNTVVFSFQNRRIMALITRVELSAGLSKPERSKSRITKARGKRVLH